MNEREKQLLIIRVNQRRSRQPQPTHGGRIVRPLGDWPDDGPTTRHATYEDIKRMPGVDIDAIHRRRK